MTGITGLVGAAFTTALLRNNPSFKIVSLCRGFCGESGQSRAEKILRQQCEFDGLPETADEILSRVKIVEGTLGQLPADEMAKEGPFDTFFHCAADVNLGKDPQGKTYATNFGGTQAALALAKRVNVPTFHYVSTAYVAGKSVGRVMEDSMPATDFNNSYERSKFDAEKLVRESGFPYTIYRPSIVVGRLSDGVIRKPLAFYRLLEFLGQVKRVGCSKAGVPANGVFKMSLRLEAGKTDKVYFVPIDYVQKAISTLFLKPVVNKTYHITGESPVSTQDIETAVCEALQTTGLCVMEKVENPTKQEQLVQRMVSDLMPYFASEIIFDNTNVRADLGDEALNWKMDISFLRKMISAYYRKANPEIMPD